MDTYGFYITNNNIYDFIAIILSVFIIFHFTLSVYYGIKTIILKTQNRFGWCPEMLVTYNSILWLILFLYVLIGSLKGSSLIDNASFGAVFIRPLILTTSIITSILQKRRYLVAVNKFRSEDYLKEKLEQED